MTDQNITFSAHGASFQEKLCFLILDDRVFADRMQEVLEIEYLETKHLQVFTQKIFDYKKKFGSHPSYDIMESILRSGLSAENEATQQLIRDYYTRVRADSRIMDGAEYIKEEALDFCRKQKIREAMIRATKLLKSCSFDEIQQVINEAMKAGADCDVGYDYIADIEKRFEAESRTAVTTGWEPFDAITKGGLGRRELGVVIAPTGGGKSMMLVHLASTALKAGLNVVYYTLELRDIVVGSRFDACITGIPLDFLQKKKDDVIGKLKQQQLGNLIIKEYPTKSASTNTIRAHLEKLRRQSFTPDVVIVDYGDLLKPLSAGKREKRDELEAIYEELRAIAQEYDAALWTASQTNRTGLNAEVITLDAIAEAYSKCFVADFIFTVSRTIEDKQGNGGRTLVAKNRNGREGDVFNIFMDTANIDIKVLGPYTGAGDSGLPQNKDQMTKQLQELYKEHMKQKKKN